jgi:hypothetical protein
MTRREHPARPGTGTGTGSGSERAAVAQPAARSTSTAFVPPKAKELDSIVRAATPARARLGT